jgi:hypothetical protein
MTDAELIARLRGCPFGTKQTDALLVEAADRIEDLSAARDTMGNLWAKERKRSRRLQDGLMEAIRLAEQPHYGNQEDALDHCFEAIDVLRATLAEIKGEKP